MLPPAVFLNHPVRSVFCALAIFFASATASTAAPLPEWAQPYVTPDALAWKKNENDVCLLDQTSVVYAAPDRRTTTTREIWRLQKLEGGSDILTLAHYNQDTDKVLSIKLWHRTANGKVRTLKREGVQDNAAYPSSHFWNAHREIIAPVPAGFASGDVLAYEVVIDEAAHPISATGWSAPSAPLYYGEFSITPPAGHTVHWSSPDPSFQPRAGTIPTRKLNRWGQPRPDPAFQPAPGSPVWKLEKHHVRVIGAPTGFYPRPTLVRATVPTTDTPFDTWQQLSRATARVIEPRIEVTPALREKAESLTRGLTTRWEKIRALTDSIQSEISYLSWDNDGDDRDVLNGVRPQSADQCLRNRFGDCKDKASLLVAYLRALGDQGHVVLLYSGNPTRVAAEKPIFSFNHAITAIPADADTPAHWPIAEHPKLGRFVLVDTTSSTDGPLGTLPLRDQTGYGLLVMPSGGDLVRLPVDAPGGHHSAPLRLEFTLKANGDAQLHLEETSSGRQFVHLQNARCQLGPKKLESELEKRLGALAPRVENLHFTETSTPTANRHELTLDANLLAFGQSAGGDLLILKFPELNAPHALAPWKTDHPGMSWLPLDECALDIVIKLPSGMELAEPLPALDLTGDGAHATYHATLADGALRLRAAYCRPGALYDQTRYNALRTLTQSYLQALKRPILLRAAPASPMATSQKAL